ncbi:iron-siderophore ABC transporter substrate-binding protein [Shouchella clausii]
MRVIRYTWIMAVAVMGLAACSSDKQALEEQEKEEHAPISVEHSMGTAKLDDYPERVVTLFQGATDTAVALDLKPVGVVESWVEQPIYEYLRPELEGVEMVGSELQPNLEEIAALEPDLIVATKSRHEQIYGQLQEIAPTIMIDPSNDFKYTLSLMGEATDLTERADERLQDWDERIADFRQQAESQLDDWPYTASVINVRSDQIRLFTGGFPGGILEEAGFIRTDGQQEAADQGDVYLEFTNTESIPEMNADLFYVFLQSNQDIEEVEAGYSEWTSHPLWAELDAVQNDQVHVVDEITWNMSAGYMAANEMLDDLYETLGLDVGEK